MKKFNEFHLIDEILHAIEDLGFEEASPIQEQTLPALIEENIDIIALAQTGTGKTAAFGLPLLQKLSSSQDNNIQAIIISPTRELCMQLEEEITKYGKYLNHLHSVAVYGGAPIRNQIRDIRKNKPQIIVATPGRLMDLMEKNIVQLNHVHTVILDEADEMLNMGFREDIESILEEVPEQRNVWLFSATMNKEVRRIAKRFMNNPKEIAVARENIGNENIHHQFYLVNHHQRYDALKRLLDTVPDIYGIIFTRTKQDAQEVAEKLSREGYQASPLHGDMDQTMRTKVMERFKKQYLQIIVATDVAARGIDVNEISHVINYELPEDPEVYTHRSGRTGRAGNTGLCWSLVTPRELGRLRQVERTAKTKFEKSLIPSGEEIIKNKLDALKEQLIHSNLELSNKCIEEHEIIEELKALPKDAIIEKLLALYLKETLDSYTKVPDLNINPKNKERDRSTKNSETRIFINLGRKDGLNPGSFVQFISDSTNLQNEDINGVTITEFTSFFNIPNESVSFVIDVLQNQKYNKRRIRIEKADSKPKNVNKGGKFDNHSNKKFKKKRNAYGKESAKFTKSRKQLKK